MASSLRSAVDLVLSECQSRAVPCDRLLAAYVIRAVREPNARETTRDTKKTNTFLFEKFAGISPRPVKRDRQRAPPLPARASWDTLDDQREAPSDSLFFVRVSLDAGAVDGGASGVMGRRDRRLLGGPEDRGGADERPGPDAGDAGVV